MLVWLFTLFFANRLLSNIFEVQRKKLLPQKACLQKALKVLLLVLLFKLLQQPYTVSLFFFLCVCFYCGSNFLFALQRPFMTATLTGVNVACNVSMCGC